MKIKNILLAGFSLAVLAACSKDEQSVHVDDMPDAKISLSLKASGPASKADTDDNALEGEMNINNITVLTFTNDGTELLNEPYKNESVTSENGVITVLNIPTKATKAIIAIMANVPQNAFGGVTNFTAFQERLAQLTEQSQTNLTMSAQLITANVALNAGDNFIGYGSQSNINNINSPLELTRLAARVELVKLSTNFASNPKLAGRIVRINSVQLLNVKTASKYSSPNYWGEVMADGNLLATTEATTLDREVSGDGPLSEVVYRRYVMENLNEASATQIQVNATLLASSGYQAETKSFIATINRTGIVSDGTNIAHRFVKRNYIYRLDIAFGPGSFTGVTEEEPTPPTPPTPPVDDNGSLNVKVEVVGWGQVSQNVDIE